MAMTEAQIQALYQVTYPINFVANGDTVHDGFHKHIQEIERIYGLLGGLERSKVTTGDLVSTLANYVTKTEFNNHVNSTNPHPNLQLATLGGNLDVSRITGNWDLSRVTGQLAVGNINMAGLIAYLGGNTGFADWIKSIAGGGGGGGSYLEQTGTVTGTVTREGVAGSSSAVYLILSGSIDINIPKAYSDTNYTAEMTTTQLKMSTGSYQNVTLYARNFTKISGSKMKLEFVYPSSLGYNLGTLSAYSDYSLENGKITLKITWKTQGTLAA